jgi:hypothetical protein
MKDLTPGKPVTLNLDGEKHTLGCVIAQLNGQTAMLVQTEAGDPQLLGRLQRRRSGYLVFSSAGTTVGLRGAAVAPPTSHPLIEFVLTDGS